MKKTLLFTLCIFAVSTTALFARNRCNKSDSKFKFELHINTGSERSGFSDPYFSNPCPCPCDSEPIYVVSPQRCSPYIVVVKQPPVRPIMVIEQEPSYVIVNRPHSFWWY